MESLPAIPTLDELQQILKELLAEILCIGLTTCFCIPESLGTLNGTIASQKALEEGTKCSFEQEFSMLLSSSVLQRITQIRTPFLAKWKSNYTIKKRERRNNTAKEVDT